MHRGAVLGSKTFKNLQRKSQANSTDKQALIPKPSKTSRNFFNFFGLDACQSKVGCYLCIRIWKTGAAFSEDGKKNNSGLGLDRNEKPRRFAARFETRVGRKAKAERLKKNSKNFLQVRKKLLTLQSQIERAARRKRRARLGREWFFELRVNNIVRVSVKDGLPRCEAWGQKKFIQWRV